MPTLERFDHAHIYVDDRAAAQRWYERVLGLRPVPELVRWAEDDGPLTVSDPARAVHLALFERPGPSRRTGTIALLVSATEFEVWREHLTRELGEEPNFQDHELSWSLYFADPDGNPYELTCYDVEALRAARP
jgi:catechol 2,3-dioxygenase-like lactoylglutathione lyase family enzyme